MSNDISEKLSLELDGQDLSVPQVCRLANEPQQASVKASDALAERLQRSADMVTQAVSQNRSIYGVTTGFGGMAGIAVPGEMAAASQNNLLAFLATGAGTPIDSRHVRTAMLLRANVLAKGCSGVRFELVDRILQLLNAGVTPVVRELGSIGASGDLVPLATIARAITGETGFVEVELDGQVMHGADALNRLNLAPLPLLPKEGLALVNGTSFSAAIAAHCVNEIRSLLAVSLVVQSMMMESLLAQRDPFESFVHAQKPHPGQVWTATILRELLNARHVEANGHSPQVQDRYSLRCFPQYMGPVVESIVRSQRVVETEMNSVSDNPLVDPETGRFYQSGNFLGQYVGIAMDDLRRSVGLLAKHLDVQIATLVAPEFNHGLPASLRGSESPAFNMGLKGLQITGNSIMPLLTHIANPLVDHFPTHAEQFNQNVNGLSWGAANLAWKSVGLFQHYLSVATVFAIQACDLRARNSFDHFDGRSTLGETATAFYEAASEAIGVAPGRQYPLIRNDRDQWIEQYLSAIHAELARRGPVVTTLNSVLTSLDSHSF